jgi:hypothetical protein
LTVALRALLRELLLLLPPRVARELGAATCAPHAAAPAAAAVRDNELHLPTTTTTSTPPTPLRSSLCNLLHTLLSHATPLASPHCKSSTAALLARLCTSSSSSSSSTATTEHESAAASGTTAAAAAARGGGRQATECGKGVRAFVFGIGHPTRNKSGPTLIANNGSCHLRATLHSLLLASFRALLLHDFMRKCDYSVAHRKIHRVQGAKERDLSSSEIARRHMHWVATQIQLKIYVVRRLNFSLHQVGL